MRIRPTKKHAKFYSKNMKGRETLQDLGSDGILLTEWVLSNKI
jgi:hypothetical protein